MLMHSCRVFSSCLFLFFALHKCCRQNFSVPSNITRQVREANPAAFLSVVEINRQKMAARHHKHNCSCHSPGVACAPPAYHPYQNKIKLTNKNKSLQKTYCLLFKKQFFWFPPTVLLCNSNKIICSKINNMK